MAKKDVQTSTTSYRFPIFILLLLLAGGGWYFWNYSSTQWKDYILQYIENGEIVTLESKYTPEQIMETHKAELIGNNLKRTYLEPSQKYYPYLLLEIKYTDNNKSKEGFLLWSMTNGELVLNTETWETTHGFKDCLDCGATREDFKILKILAKKPSTSIEDLQKELHIESDMAKEWIDSAKSKHLIVQNGNIIQLHFENPKILTTAQTQVKQHFVSKPISVNQRIPKVFSRSKIIDLAKASFGHDLKIRSEEEIFLPAYGISVLNPDGSVHTSDWNAVNGKKMSGL